MTNLVQLSDDDGKKLLSDTLRLFVGHKRRFSWGDLAIATGDDERKLRSYVEADPPTMPMTVFLRIFAVLPVEAFARIARHIGFSAAPLDVEDGATVRRSLSMAARLVADGNEFLEDGRLTPTERAKLADGAHDLIPMLQVIAGGRSEG